MRVLYEGIYEAGCLLSVTVATSATEGAEAVAVAVGSIVMGVQVLPPLAVRNTTPTTPPPGRVWSFPSMVQMVGEDQAALTYCTPMPLALFRWGRGGERGVVV